MEFKPDFSVNKAQRLSKGPPRGRSLFVVGLSGEEHGELCGSGGVELSEGNGGKGAGGKIRLEMNSS
nr:hypothetical protein [Tanacetum cinerariifolium]